MSKTCPACGMSYIRGAVEDEDLHKSYCKKLAKGVEWPFAGNHPGCKVLAENIWLGEMEGKIVMAEGCPAGALSKKVEGWPLASCTKLTVFQLDEIECTVNHAMGATSVETAADEPVRYLLFLARGSGGTATRVIGCAIASRIKQAFRAVDAPGSAAQRTCLRFGEDDGAIFCRSVI